MTFLSFIELTDHDLGSWIGLYAGLFLIWAILKALGLLKP